VQVFGQEAVVGGKEGAGLAAHPHFGPPKMSLYMCMCVCAHGISFSVQMQRITLRAINI